MHIAINVTTLRDYPVHIYDPIAMGVTMALFSL
jgi:hypothetical protein